MENLVWGMIFVTEVMKYILGEKIFFKRDVKRRWAGCAGLLIYMCIIGSMPIVSEEEQHIIVYAFAVLTTYIMVYQKKIEDFVHILILFIEVSCIEGLVEKMIFNLWLREEYLHLSKEYQLLITGIVVTFIFYTVYIFCKQKRAFETKIRMEYIWILVLCMVVNILLTAAGLYVVKEYVNNQRLQFIMTITNVCSYISVGLVVLFITYIRNANQKLQQLLTTEKQLKEAQEQYYRSLLKKEEETRRNRHDWNNHLICLAELAKKENADSTKQYIDTLIKQNDYLKEKQYDVGNDILNAILCYHFWELEDDISVKVVGRCRNDINIEAADLCVIVSNLIQNAVEYLKNSNMQEKMVLFSIEEGKVYKRISIANSVESNVSESKLKTTIKSDKKNHGIGLQNVRETIERNNGKLEINIQDGMFKADVIWK